VDSLDCVEIYYHVTSILYVNNEFGAAAGSYLTDRTELFAAIR
jgi:hypothetical protein